MATTYSMKMPGHHYLSDEYQEEDDELIDGVKPSDHPETYSYLFELRCIVSSEGEIYQRISDCYKICGSCFSKVPEDYRQEYAIVLPHNLIHRASVENQTRCTHCYKIIIKIRPVEECRGCIGKYLGTDKTYLNEGWGAPVFA